MKTIQIKVYPFSELSDQSKDYALDKLRDYNLFYDWYRSIFDDFSDITQAIGLTVDPENIHFRGFYSQGDGSSFGAEVDLKRLIEGINTESWKNYAPKLDFDLSRPKIDKRVLNLIINQQLDILSSIDSKGRNFSMVTNIQFYWPNNAHDYSNIDQEILSLETWLQNVANELNDFLYKSLRDEYEYQTSDEALADAFEANDIFFTIDGKPASRLVNLSEHEK